MSGIDKPQKKLSKREKAQKFGKRFSSAYLNYVKDATGGDLEGFKKSLEQQEQLQQDLISKKEAHDPAVLAYKKKQGLQLKDNLTAMMRSMAVKKSLSVGKNTTNAADLKRYLNATKVARDELNAYATLQTNLGLLRFELYAAKTPTAVENFLTHCENGYYNGVEFHKLVPGVLLQGGDPTKTGEGGESIWGAPFQDEIISTLSHSARGVLSMANVGADMNKSQFFVTLGPCTQRDGEHTIFGRLVGGFEVLARIEQTPTSADDRPAAPITITGAQVHWNPFKHVEEPGK